MKKMNFILKLFVIAVIVVFSACSKDEKATPVTVPGTQTLTTVKTATVTGIVHAQLIDSVDINKQFVPANTVLLFSYKLNQFHPYLTTTEQTVQCAPVPVSTSDGSYSITVPAVATGIKITLATNQFVYGQHTFSSTLKDSTIRTIYTLSSKDISGLVPGQTQIVDLFYSTAK